MSNHAFGIGKHLCRQWRLQQLLALHKFVVGCQPNQVGQSATATTNVMFDCTLHCMYWFGLVWFGLVLDTCSSNAMWGMAHVPHMVLESLVLAGRSLLLLVAPVHSHMLYVYACYVNPLSALQQHPPAVLAAVALAIISLAIMAIACLVCNSIVANCCTN
jgi:hypothetical protein